MTNTQSSFSAASGKVESSMLKIFQSLPGLYLVLTPDFFIQAASDAYLKESLSVREEIVGRYVFDVFPENPAAPEAKAGTNLMASFQQVLSSRKPHTMDLQQYDVQDPTDSGSFLERYWSVTNTPVLNEQKEVEYIIHEVMNVTEKVKADQALKESQGREELALQKAEQQRARLERFLMQAPAIIVVHDGPDFVFEFVNPLYQQVFPGRELLGKPLLEGLPELAETPIWDIIQRVYQTGETYEGKEVWIPLAEYEGGPLRNNYYNFIYQARFDEQGKVDGIMVFAYDVSGQVEARKLVEENVGHLRLTANAMPQKMWTATADGEVDYYNEKWMEYTGLSFDELKGWGWTKIIHPEDLEENEKAWKHSLETGLDYQLEHRFKKKDGQYRWHLTRAIAQRNDDGSIRMWIGTNTDIHDQKMTEQSLQELTSELRTTNQQLTRINVDLDNFIYTASHDLKAPITNIEGLLKLLQKQLPEENIKQNSLQARPILGMMEASVERFKKTISHLTDITKLHKDAQQEASRVSTAEIIKEVMLDLDQMIRESGARIEEDTDECPIIIFAQKNLRSVVYNLLSNSIKYRSAERSPLVRISCRSTPGFAILEVQDNGLGIDLSKKEKMFSMFTRLHSHVEGSGIGLFMVKRIVENSGGKIEVSSKLGEGSTFTVYFRQ